MGHGPSRERIHARTKARKRDRSNAVLSPAENHAGTRTLRHSRSQRSVSAVLGSPGLLFDCARSTGVPMVRGAPSLRFSSSRSLHGGTAASPTDCHGERRRRPWRILRERCESGVKIRVAENGAPQERVLSKSARQAEEGLSAPLKAAFDELCGPNKAPIRRTRGSGDWIAGTLLLVCDRARM